MELPNHEAARQGSQAAPPEIMIMGCEFNLDGDVPPLPSSAHEYLLSQRLNEP